MHGSGFESLALRHTVCGLENLPMENPQNPPKARFLRAFCLSGFGLSGPGDAWDRPRWAIFLQAAMRQSLVAGRVEAEVGPLGAPIQWNALFETLQTQGFRYITGDYRFHDIRCQEGQFS